MAAAQRFMSNLPARMESSSRTRGPAPPVPSAVLAAELRPLWCEPLPAGAGRLPECEEPEAFELHRQFVQAHGLPAGQITTFIRGWHCRERRSVALARGAHRE